MEIQEKYLPIGSVVLLKGGKKELMVMGYDIIPDGDAYDKNGKVDVSDKIFDYGGCVYPEGMVTSNQIFAFNHEQIEKVSFIGYQTESQENLSNLLKQTHKEVEKYQQQKQNEKQESEKED